MSQVKEIKFRLNKAINVLRDIEETMLSNMDWQGILGDATTPFHNMRNLHTALNQQVAIGNLTATGWEDMLNAARTLELDAVNLRNMCQHRLLGAGTTYTHHQEFLNLPHERPTRIVIQIDGVEHELQVNPTAVASGGFGMILLARTTDSNLTLALKCPGSETKQDERRRFMREGSIWKTLDHEHVLKLYGVIRHEGSCWLVSRYCEGGTILRFVTENPSFPKSRLLRDLANALAYVHGQDVIHGDIRGANAITRQDGHVFLCDFGLSKRSGDNTSEGTKGRGAHLWMSPERLLDDAPRTKESDVYAFGITIAEVLSYGSLFPNLKSPDHIFMMMEKSKRTFRPAVPAGALGRIAQLCWVTDPSKRCLMAEVHGWLTVVAAGGEPALPMVTL